ncbi:MAG TPA: hypothetical protein VK574_21315 [Terracidiphilus sp.]|nr:hypothetical protein [Terracidiphilus sp.]
MRPYIYRLLWILVSTVVFAASGFASPLNNPLLPLVPPGAEIVAGFDNHPTGHEHGRLLLSTHNDRLDLDDWQGLAGVDSKRVIDEVIEVAASSASGRLTEHLLLVAGHFNRERIFKAAELNGAQRSEFQGETALLIKPFDREQGEMLDARWLVILNDHIAMLGTRTMVQSALRRYATHADIDMPLMERLAQMRRDVTSWTILMGSPKTEGSLALTQPNSVLTRLLDGAEVLMIGARFSARIRVDFSLHGRNDHQSEFLTEKPASLADVFAKEPLLLSGSPPQSQSRLGNLSMELDCIQGSVELSQKDFEQWNRQGGFTRRSQGQATRTLSHGE